MRTHSDQKKSQIVNWIANCDTNSYQVKCVVKTEIRGNTKDNGLAVRGKTIIRATLR